MMLVLFYLFLDVSINTIALNVLCISHERCRRLKASCPGVPSLFQTITFIWGVGMAVAIPTYFTTTFVSHTHQDGEVHSTCCRVSAKNMYQMMSTC